MLFIVIIFLTFPFYHSLLLFPTLVPEMLFIEILFIAFLVAIFNRENFCAVLGDSRLDSFQDFVVEDTPEDSLKLYAILGSKE